MAFLLLINTSSHSFESFQIRSDIVIQDQNTWVSQKGSSEYLHSYTKKKFRFNQIINSGQIMIQIKESSPKPNRALVKM